MKVTDLINILTEIEKTHKGWSIWSISDLDCACPNDFGIELVNKIIKNQGCLNGGKKLIDVKVYCDYREVEGKENELIDYDLVKEGDK